MLLVICLSVPHTHTKTHTHTLQRELLHGHLKHLVVSFSCSPSLSLSLTHTHTHTHKALNDINTPTHPKTHTGTQVHTTYVCSALCVRQQTPASAKPKHNNHKNRPNQQQRKTESRNIATRRIQPCTNKTIRRMQPCTNTTIRKIRPCTNTSIRKIQPCTNKTIRTTGLCTKVRRTCSIRSFHSGSQDNHFT